MKQVLEGLFALEANKVVHCDIKPLNIFMKSLEPKYEICIGDFGISKVLMPGEICYKMNGTPSYMAPEIFS